MAKSILHNKKDRTCFLCMKLYGDDSWKEVLHKHHVFQGHGTRNKSEDCGLTVWLCPRHHDIGPESVHFNKKNDKLLKVYAKREFLETNPDVRFLDLFYKEYVDLDEEENMENIEENVEKSGSVAGFTLISDGLEGMDW